VKNYGNAYFRRTPLVEVELKTDVTQSFIYKTLKQFTSVIQEETIWLAAK